MAGMIGVAFDITAARRGDHWKLSDDEKKALGDAAGNALRHVPIPEKEAGIFFDLTALGFVGFAIMSPRLELDRMAAERAQPAPLQERRVDGNPTDGWPQEDALVERLQTPDPRVAGRV